MRILRIRLRNYRGVAEHEVELPATGVTVIEGDNEIGKSSLAEALDVLFEFPDSSTNKTIKAIKPVHRDAGTEIEVDVEAGPYRFTYLKRFHRERQTVLTVHEPRRENLTGRDAHERAQAIMAEAVDVPLWRALRLQQGVRPDQADLSEQTSLAAALDAASAGALAGEREAGLVDLARAEMERYWTAGRRQARVEVAELVRAEQACELRVADLRARLAGLEDDVEHAAALVSAIEALGGSVAAQAAKVADYEGQWRAVSSVVQALETAQAKAAAAEAEHRSAVEAVVQRRALVDGLEAEERRVRETSDELALRAPALASARAALETAEVALADATERAEAARSALDARQREFQHARDSLDLAQLHERFERVQEAQQKLAELDAVLDGAAVGDAELSAIEDAHVAVEKARARVEVESPVITVSALAPVAVQVEGQVEALAAGGQTSVTLGADTELVVGDVARIAVRNVREGGELVAAVTAAEERLARLCASAGVAGVAEAKAAAAARRDAVRERDSLVARMKADLRDLTPERLAGKFERLRARLADAEGEPLDFDTARQLEEEARAEAEAALRLLREATDEVSVRRDAVARLVREFDKAENKLDLAKRQAERAREDVEAARARVPDGVLAGRVESAELRLAEARAGLEAAAAAAAAARPDELRLAFDNAKAVLEKLEADRRGAERELTQVRSRLEVLGEQGLHDQLAAAESELEHVQRQRRSTERRAAAARRLFETLDRCRGEARRAYVAPLKTKIERLGRIVYGETFGVEVAEDLRIRTRTLHGVTVEFDQLSTGAREQLCVISRLACATIVAAEGGVPVILDDALGWSDAKRLERLGAVLSVAAQDAQVLVLTCMPERYRHVGSANVVRLSRPAPTDPAAPTTTTPAGAA